MIGPPTSAPSVAMWSRFVFVRMTDALLGTLLRGPLSAPGEYCPHQWPLTSFEPEFVTAERMPPVLRPYSGK